MHVLHISSYKYYNESNMFQMTITPYLRKITKRFPVNGYV